MTTVFKPVGNDVQVVSIADDSSNFVAELTRNSGSFGNVVMVTNIDSGNVVYVSTGWSEFDTVAIVPVPGTPGVGVPVMPGSSTLLLINTANQATVGVNLYLAAAVDGTADIVINQGAGA